jgi:hypothetical protein
VYLPVVGDLTQRGSSGGPSKTGALGLLRLNRGIERPNLPRPMLPLAFQQEAAAVTKSALFFLVPREPKGLFF